MKLISSILLVLFILLAIACNRGHHKNNSGNDSTTTNEVTKAIEMYKGPCFGQCPIYTMSIYTDGKVEYNGQRFTDKIGVFTKKISTDRVKDLLEDLEKMKFWEMQEWYKGNLPDLAKTHITYTKGDQTKTVKGDNTRPELLKALDKKLVAIAGSDDWTLIKKHEDKVAYPDYTIKEEIIVSFESDIDIPNFITSKKQYDLEIKKRVAPNLDMWVLTYDLDKINPTDMLNMLQTSNGVKQAEFNKRINPREH